MLHQINVSVCHNHLEWVVDLQLKLLEGICNSEVCGSDIAIPWVEASLPSTEPKWIVELCESYKEKNLTLLGYMQKIANFPVDIKQVLLSAFKHDLSVIEDFSQGKRPGRTMQSIRSFNKEQKDIIKNFFKLFYEPNFDKGKGFPSSTINGNTVKFDRPKFADQFGRGNSVKVCPLCDGGLGLGQVDHFYPKSHYPFFSCHPLNLIPICKDCNMAPCKGEKPPIDQSVLVNQMEEWFHPIFEPLANWRDVRNRPARTQFRLEFVRENGINTPVLTSDDARTTARLANLNNLVNLQDRWRKELVNQFQGLIDIIQQYREERGEAMSEQELIRRLKVATEEAKGRIGTRPHAILEFFFSELASQRDNDLFFELWIENIGADPLTGAG